MYVGGRRGERINESEIGRCAMAHQEAGGSVKVKGFRIRH